MTLIPQFIKSVIPWTRTVIPVSRDMLEAWDRMTPEAKASSLYLLTGNRRLLLAEMDVPEAPKRVAETIARYRLVRRAV